jgi:hypothetical protein
MSYPWTTPQPNAHLPLRRDVGNGKFSNGTQTVLEPPANLDRRAKFADCGAQAVHREFIHRKQ